MSNVNVVVYGGRLTRDPDLKYTPGGHAVGGFAVASNRKFNKKDGTKAETVAFLDVTVWNRMAEICSEYLKKGREVLVTGHLVMDEWEDPKTGQKRTKIRLEAESVQFIGRGSQEEAAPAEEAPAEETPQAATPRAAAGRQPARAARR